MRAYWTDILILMECMEWVLGARILVIPLPYSSHMLANNAIGQQLKLNGHEVGC